MKRRMTISVEAELGERIRAEAARDGVDVSTWMARLADAEATRRAFAEVAEHRRRAGVYSGRRMEAFAQRRAALHRAGR